MAFQCRNDINHAKLRKNSNKIVFGCMLLGIFNRNSLLHDILADAAEDCSIQFTHAGILHHKHESN